MLAISNCSGMTSRLLQLNSFPTHRALIELSSYYWEPRKARKILLWSEIKAKFRRKFSTSKSACNPTILEFLQIFTPSKPFTDNKLESKAFEVFEVNLLLALYRQISVLFSRKKPILRKAISSTIYSSRFHPAPTLLSNYKRASQAAETDIVEIKNKMNKINKQSFVINMENHFRSGTWRLMEKWRSN